MQRIFVQSISLVLVLFLFSCQELPKIDFYIKNLPLESVPFLKDKLNENDLAALSLGENSPAWNLISKNDYSIVAAAKEDTLYVQIFNPTDKKNVFTAVRLTDGIGESVSFLSYITNEKRWDAQTNPFQFPPLASFAASNAAVPKELITERSFYSYKFKKDTFEIHLDAYRFGVAIESQLQILESQSSRFNKKNYVKYFSEIIWDGKKFSVKRHEWNEYNPVFDVIAFNAEPDLELGEVDEGPGTFYWTCPHSVSLTTSSTLPPQGSSRYDAKNLLDEDNKTAWVEGATSFGMKEKIQFVLNKNKIGDSFLFVNGFAKSKDSWRNNNRVKLLSCKINSTAHARFIFDDSDKVQKFGMFPQWLKFPELKEGDRIEFFIEEIYKGEKYDDTAITLFMPEGECY
jgi:hypothetical protein